MSAPYKKCVCPACGSEAIEVDASVTWNPNAQNWTLKGVHPNNDTTCGGCGASVDLDDCWQEV